MLKTLSLVLAGLGAALAIALWLAPRSEPPVEQIVVAAPAARSTAGDSGFAEARLAALEDAFAAEVDRRVELEAQVAELSAQLKSLGERPRFGLAGAANGPGGGPAPDVREIRAREQADRRAVEQQAERRFVERLTAAGFAPDRAEWIVRRTEELRMQALQAQYDAQRGGRPVDPGAGVQTLRTELGEADYERYLQADGRPTTVPVRDVLASSPAERSGLQPGDEIVSYAGKRVFDMRELNALTLEGTPGESVVVDVRRDGQNVQLVMPRGPVGIMGGGFRGR